jgi:hypothetical protein
MQEEHSDLSFLPESRRGSSLREGTLPVAGGRKTFLSPEMGVKAREICTNEPC